MRTPVLVALLSLLSGGAFADGCDSFKWNLTPEYSLYAGTPMTQQAGTEAGKAPLLKTGTLYELKLTPQSDVSYPLAPGKKMLTDGAFGGVIRFTVPASGDYRIGLDTPFWIDVVADGQLVKSKDFGGPQGCAKPPHKLVQFELKSGTTYLLQFSGQTQPSVHVTVVKSEPAKG